jgi:hypothetical protein
MTDQEIVSMLGRKRDVRANKNGTPKKASSTRNLARGRAGSRSPGRNGSRFGADATTSPGPGGADINASAWKDLQKQRAQPNTSRTAWGSSANSTSNARSRGGSLGGSFDASIGNSSFDGGNGGAAGKSRGSTRGSTDSSTAGAGARKSSISKGGSRGTTRGSTKTTSPGRGERGPRPPASAGEDGNALPPIMSPRASLARGRMRESSVGKLPPVISPSGKAMIPMPPDAPKSPPSQAYSAWGEGD